MNQIFSSDSHAERKYSEIYLFMGKLEFLVLRKGLFDLSFNDSPLIPIQYSNRDMALSFLSAID